MSQLSTKFLQNNAVTGQKIRLGSTETLRARNAAGTADISLLHTNSSDQIEIPGPLYLAANQIKNVADPSTSTDAATKNYVDMALQGLSPKAPVAAATAAPLPSNTYSNGSSGVGATLTGTTNGALANIDGYTPIAGDRLLIINEVTAANNGIYVVTQLGTSSLPYILTRTPDANTPANLKGAYTFALSGATQDDNSFLLTLALDAVIVIGTTPLTFVNYGSSGISAGNGITKSGNTVSVNAGSGLTFSGAQLIAQTQGPGTGNTTGIDASGNIKALKSLKSTFTLSSSDITNQYVDLSVVAHTGSIQLTPTYGLTQIEGSDYSVNYTGGTSSKTRISFLGDLATGGAAALVSGDILNIACLTL